MNSAKIDVSNGNILIEGAVIAPLRLDQFMEASKRSKINIIEINPVKGWKNFGIDVTIENFEFGLNVTYHEGNLYSCWLSWDGGISKIKAYYTTKNELIFDKNTLTKFLTKIIGKPPEQKSYVHDIFLFHWGYISTSASFKSTMVTIGISWKFSSHNSP